MSTAAASTEGATDAAVAFDARLGWVVRGHAEVLRVLHDPDTFSNVVSPRLSVPNGMDPPAHTAFRRIIEPYFGPRALAAVRPALDRIAEQLVRPLDGETEIMDGLAHPFAVRVQCAFMGWPDHLHGPLRDWMTSNQAAIRAQDRGRLEELAGEFDTIIRAQLDPRRPGDPDGDVTSRLLTEQVDGRALTDAELVSLIRNWTAGELGTIAASVGIIVHHLAVDDELADHLRRSPAELPAAIDEILRLEGPLTANRRRTTRPVVLGGCSLPADTPLTILWPDANRDRRVFAPGRFAPAEHAHDNLLYGAGLHVCPGAPLARLELEILTGTLLTQTRRIVLAGTARRADHPVGGFTAVAVRLQRAGSG